MEHTKTTKVEIGHFLLLEMVPFQTSKIFRQKRVERRRVKIQCKKCANVSTDFYDVIKKGKVCQLCPKVKSVKPSENLGDYEAPQFHKNKGCKVCNGPLELKYHKECSKCRTDVVFWTKDGTVNYWTTLPNEWIGYV